MDVLAEGVLSAAGGCVIWEEGTEGFGWGAEVLSLLHERIGTGLGAARRMASHATVIPAAKHLEKYVLADIDKVETAITEITALAMGN
jgi:pyruvate/2-oxoglutarate/acetoin dehydrogenase E1 component